VSVLLLVALHECTVLCLVCVVSDCMTTNSVFEWLHLVLCCVGTMLCAGSSQYHDMPVVQSSRAQGCGLFG
jgi:hypothetical protein